MIYIVIDNKSSENILSDFIDRHPGCILIDNRDKGFFLRYIKLLAESTNLVRIKTGNDYVEKVANDSIILYISYTELRNPLTYIAAKHCAVLLNLDVQVVKLNKQRKEQQ